MHQAAVSFALLAGALLVVAGLFTDVQDGIEQLDPVMPNQRIADEVPRFEESLQLEPDALRHGMLEGLKLDQDILFELPAGTHVIGDEIVLADDLELVLPAGSELESFAGLLPEGTIVRIAPGSSASAAVDLIRLAPETRLVLPGGTRLVLTDGGDLWHARADTAALHQAVRQGRLITDPGARLEAPLVALLDDWRLHLAEGTRFRLPADWRPPAEWAVADGRLTSDTHVVLPAGTPMRSGAPVDGATGQAFLSQGLADMRANAAVPPTDAAPAASETTPRGWGPPDWAPLVLLGVLAATAGFWLRRRHRHAPRHATLDSTASRTRDWLHTRVETREPDLPLAFDPETGGNLQFAVVAPPRGQGKPAPRPAHVTLRLDGKRVFRGAVPREGGAVDLSTITAGDHVLTATMRLGRFRRARTEERVVRGAAWAEQVARDWQGVVDALGAHGALREGATPQQVRTALARIAPAVEARVGALLVATFEEASYSPRAVRAADWERFAVAAREAERAIAANARPARRDGRRHARRADVPTVAPHAAG